MELTIKQMAYILEEFRKDPMITDYSLALKLDVSRHRIRDLVRYMKIRGLIESEQFKESNNAKFRRRITILKDEV